MSLFMNKHFGFMMKKFLTLKFTGLSLAVASVLSCSAAMAADTIDSIQIRGLNRVSKGAVLLALPIKEGDVLTSEKISEAMQSLYATGDFDDVSLSRSGDTLFVNVKERSTIGAIDFSGNSNIKEEQLKKIIESQGIRIGEPLNVQALNLIKKSLEDFYHSAGMYQASVNPVLTQLPRSRVNIKIEITEGKGAEIQQINIVGNKSFPEDVLLAQMELRDDVPWWNFVANQRYSGQKFVGDLESLKSFYMNRGYVNFDIESTSVELTPDRKHIYVTIAIKEGDKYTIGKTSVRGDTLKYREELEAALDLDEGSTYNQHQITLNEKTLASVLGKYGYADNVVKAYPIINEKDKIVDLEFNVIPGKRVNVSQVEISGNEVSDDTVIRREMRQMDGSWLSSEAIENSKARLNRLGYFEEVNVTTEKTGGSEDTVDVKVNVKERPTGSISGGIGLGTDSGITLSAAISQNNLFGWGTHAALISTKNDYRRHIEASYEDPYFTVDNVSLGGRFYVDHYNGDDDSKVADYTNNTIGFMANMGYPISENTRVNYSAGVERTKIKNNGVRFEQADHFFSLYGKSDEGTATFRNYKLGFDITHSTLNKGVFPTEGGRQNFSAMITAPSSDIHYYKATIEACEYIPFDNYHEYVFTVRGRMGYGNGYREKNGSKEILPFFDSFYLGGQEWLRGFNRNSIGPKALYLDKNTGTYYESSTSVGGNAFWAATAEFIVPTPLVAEAYKNNVRTALFFDAGALWDTRSKMYTVDYSKPGRYRTSLGLSVTWMSPMGPLSFSFAKAVKKYSGDDTEVFNFNIGGTF